MQQAEQSDSGKRSQNKVFFRAGFYWIAAGAVILITVVIYYSRVFSTLEAQYTFIGQNVLNVLIIAAITVQALIYRRQWDSMQASLHQTEKSSIYAQRAYVTAKIRGTGEGSFQLRLRIENSGNTPANDVWIYYGYGRREKPPHDETEKPVVFSDEFTETERVGLIAPNKSYHVIRTPKVSPISREELRRWILGEIKFYCWGRIVYEDIFNRKWDSYFCFVVSQRHPHGYPCQYGNSAR